MCSGFGMHPHDERHDERNAHRPPARSSDHAHPRHAARWSPPMPAQSPLALVLLFSCLWAGSLCSFGFQEVGRTFEMRLPIDKGASREEWPPGVCVPPYILLAMFWADGKTTRQLGNTKPTDDELPKLVQQAR